MFPTRVLVAVDGSESAEHAASEASRLCFRTGSELHVVHVTLASMANVWAGAEAVGWWYTDDKRLKEIEERGEREGRDLLEGQVEKISGSGVEVEQSHLKMGQVDARIAEVAEEIGAGLVMVGSRGCGAFGQAVLGSVSNSLIHHAPCSVLVVRGHEGNTRAGGLSAGTVLAGYDGSEIAQEAVQVGTELAEALNSELHVGSVVDMSKIVPFAHPYAQAGWDKDVKEAEEETGKLLDDLLASLANGEASARATPHVRAGQPAVELVALSEELDAGITVVGNRGRGGIRRALLGSVSTSVAHRSPGSVLVHRQKQ